MAGNPTPRTPPRTPVIPFFRGASGAESPRSSGRPWRPRSARLGRCGVWRRLRFLVASLAAILVPLVVVVHLARVGPEVLAVGALGSRVDRYENSLPELVFARLRLVNGLEPEWMDLPVSFRPWWVMTH